MITHRRSAWLPVLALLFSLLVALSSCAGDEGADEVTSSSASTSEVPSTQTPIEPFAEPAMGETEVGIVTNLPLLNAEWNHINLDPGFNAHDVWLNHVGFADGGYVAVAFGWHAPPENQTVFTWRSTDGLTWDLTETSIPQGENMYNVVESGGVLMGLGQEFPPGEPGFPKVWIARPDGTWDPLDTTDESLADLHVMGAAKTDAGYLLGAAWDSYTPLGTMGFDVNGYRFEVDDYEGRYALTEVDTGRVVSAGEMSEIYQYSESGQAVYSLETGELLTVVPWEVWDDLYPKFSPLPVPMPAEHEYGAAATIEWDGYEITVSEIDDYYRVTRDDALVSEGPLHIMYRGPAPRFVDSTSGEMVLEFTWEEWDMRMEAAYEELYEHDHVQHESEQVLLFSPDGSNWQRHSLTSDENTHLESVSAIDGTFVASIIHHLDYATDRDVFTSNDGITWTEIEASGPAYTENIHTGPGGLIALSYSGEQSVVITSEDGIDWTNSISLGPQDDGSHGWVRAVASGDDGRAVVATLSPDAPYVPLQIQVGDLTAEFGAPSWAVRVTGPDGEPVLELSWSEVEEAAGDEDPRFLEYAHEGLEVGETRIYNHDGDLVVTIPDDLVDEAFQSQTDAYDEELDHVLMLELESGWHEVDFPDDHEPEIMAVGAGEILIGTVDYEPSDYEDAPPAEMGVLIGTITD